MRGLRESRVCPGIVSAMFPQNDALKFSSGAVCGQAIMAAIDSVALRLKSRKGLNGTMWILGCLYFGVDVTRCNRVQSVSGTKVERLSPLFWSTISITSGSTPTSPK